MASTIDRETWTDDTGTAADPNEDGTLIGNDELQEDIYDKIDEMFAGAGAYSTFTFGNAIAAASLVLSGAFSAASIAISGALSAASAAISGAVTIGTTLVVSGVTTVNAALNASGLISGSIGFAERGRGVAIGEWTVVPFSASDYDSFTAVNPTVVSSNVLANEYTLIGEMMIWKIWVENFTIVSTTEQYLTVERPPGVPDDFQVSSGVRCARALNNGAAVQVVARVLDDTHIFLFREDGNDWAIGTGNNAFELTIELRLQ